MKAKHYFEMKPRRIHEPATKNYVIKCTGGHLGKKVRYFHPSGLLTGDKSAALRVGPHQARALVAINYKEASCDLLVDKI
jgi:hypothetical protein